jgi:hypothetical protein
VAPFGGFWLFSVGLLHSYFIASSAARRHQLAIADCVSFGLVDTHGSLATNNSEERAARDSDHSLKSANQRRSARVPRSHVRPLRPEGFRTLVLRLHRGGSHGTRLRRQAMNIGSRDLLAPHTHHLDNATRVRPQRRGVGEVMLEISDKRIQARARPVHLVDLVEQHADTLSGSCCIARSTSRQITLPLASQMPRDPARERSASSSTSPPRSPPRGRRERITAHARLNPLVCLAAFRPMLSGSAAIDPIAIAAT